MSLIDTKGTLDPIVIHRNAEHAVIEFIYPKLSGGRLVGLKMSFSNLKTHTKLHTKISVNFIIHMFHIVNYLLIRLIT